MLRPDSMQESSLKQVAEQLTEWFGDEMTRKMSDARLTEPSPVADEIMPESAGTQRADYISLPPEFTLAETFDIYILGANLIDPAIDSGEDLSKLAQWTHRAHHQIKVDNEAVGYACSLIGPESPEVSQLFVSDLAKAYDQSIKWLDEFEKEHQDEMVEDRLVRVLLVPAYQVHAFWLLAENETSELLVIAAPAELKDLQTDRLLSSEDFLKAFKDVKPFAGMTLTSAANEPLRRPIMPDDDEKKFSVPDTNNEPPIFLGEVYAATRSKGQIEFDLAKPGPGEPIYSAYIFGFAPTEQQKQDAQNADAELPLFVSYIYPYHDPGSVMVLQGGGAGAVSDLGGAPGREILFYSRIRSFNKTTAEPEE